VEALDTAVEHATSFLRIWENTEARVKRVGGLSEKAGDWLDRVVLLSHPFKRTHKSGIALIAAPSLSDITGAAKRMERDPTTPVHPYWFCAPEEASAYRSLLGTGYVVPASVDEKGTVRVEVQHGTWIELDAFIEAVMAYAHGTGGERALRPDAYRDAETLRHGHPHTAVIPTWAASSIGRPVEVLLGDPTTRSGTTGTLWLPVVYVHQVIRAADDTIWADVDLAREGEVEPPAEGTVLYAPTAARRAAIRLSWRAESRPWQVIQRRVPEPGSEAARERKTTPDRGLRERELTEVVVFQRMQSADGRFVILPVTGDLLVVRGARAITIDEGGDHRLDLGCV
jgi:hypothetical protein